MCVVNIFSILLLISHELRDTTVSLGRQLFSKFEEMIDICNIPVTQEINLIWNLTRIGIKTLKLIWNESADTIKRSTLILLYDNATLFTKI